MANTPKFTPHPQSAPGDFYVEQGQCLACGIPHVVAPRLMGWTDEKHPHCIWKKQPETREEIEQAITVFEVQELDCHRYAGTDPMILNRILSTACDYPLPQPNASGPEARSACDIPRFTSLEQQSLLTKVWRRLTRRR